jgi:hypothetical protein
MMCCVLLKLIAWYNKPSTHSHTHSHRQFDEHGPLTNKALLQKLDKDAPMVEHLFLLPGQGK